MATLQEQIIAKAQDHIRTSAFQAADRNGSILAEIGNEIAARHRGRAITAPTKGAERAAAKVKDDYGGDWFGIRDLVRMTIVVPTQEACEQVMAEIRRRFTASEGMGVAEIKRVDASRDACGYSGMTAFVRLPGDGLAEIQINTPQIMFAKFGKKEFEAVFGVAEHTAMRARFWGLPGGMGHKLYEVYRVAPNSGRAQSCAALSRRYYEYFRSTLPKPGEREAILAGLRTLNINPVD